MVSETPKFYHVPNTLTGEALDRSNRASAVRAIIADHFRRTSGYDLSVQPFELDREASTPPPVFCSDRPDCARWCTGLWSAQIDQLRESSDTFWLTTVCGRFCAIVPFSDDGRRVQAMRLACTADVGEDAWVGHLEFVNLLTRSVNETGARESEVEEGLDVCEEDAAAVCHPLVAKARMLIERRLADCELTVAGVADVLNVNATYLSHVFATETGQRMSRYINQRRIEKAQRLLATTDWSIKRIGFECGFANASWFGQRFRDHAKMTPGEYRRHALEV